MLSALVHRIGYFELVKLVVILKQDPKSNEVRNICRIFMEPHETHETFNTLATLTPALYHSYWSPSDQLFSRTTEIFQIVDQNLSVSQFI